MRAPVPTATAPTIPLPGLRALWRTFTRDLFPYPSTATLFNQYADAIPSLDRRGAAARRRRNLRAYLASFTAPPRLLLVGEAVGYRGGRFTGIPLTSERLLLDQQAFPYAAQPTSRGEPYAEPTASILWSLLGPYRSQVIAWNSVPLHPHVPGDPLTNRAPRVPERRAFLFLLQAVYSRVGVEHAVALGNHAAAALTELGIPHTKVRHPANGGATAFRRQMGALLREFAMVPHKEPSPAARGQGEGSGG